MYVTKLVGTDEQYADGCAALIDHLMQRFAIKNHAQLARELEVLPPVISKLYRGRMELSAAMMIAIHERFLLSIAEIKAAVACKSVAEAKKLKLI